ncbi:MAG TPA: DUF2116 family Zn-ribbon domain-containing protein [Chthonomonadaceae bacterium]|nr:DUF2116 family Zn-ribbon domain-containing protein [Chthonomonadaceae bacterium]
MSQQTENCPLCGHPLTPDSGQCPNCGWTQTSRQQSEEKRAYLIFVILMLVLGVVTILVAMRLTGESPWHPN